MRPTTSDAAHRARGAFAVTDRSTRLHIVARQWMAPFDELEALVPRDGDVLDVGCGHGLFAVQLALGSVGRSVHGVDIDAGKVARARRVVAGADLDGRVAIELVAPGWLPTEESFDAVVISDVLYLMEDTAIDAIVEAACRALAPGGRLIVKEISTTPRWKHLVTLAEEVLAVRVLRITEGSHLNPDPLAAVLATLRRVGWSADQVSLHAGYPYSHHAVLSTRPA